MKTFPKELINHDESVRYNVKNPGINVESECQDSEYFESLIRALLRLGAHRLGHVHGNLLDHLTYTYRYLKDWGNREALCVAGLFHSVYSTHGYQSSICDINRRDKVIAIIGEEAETIVYYFAACDRDDFYPRIGTEYPVIFLNRFLKETQPLDHRLLCDLLELTMANQLEIARHSEKAKAQSCKLFSDFFDRSRPYVSDQAFNYYKQFFNG